MTKSIQLKHLPIVQLKSLVHSNIKQNTLCLLDSAFTVCAISIDYAKANRLNINPINSLFNNLLLLKSILTSFLESRELRLIIKTLCIL